MPASELLDVVMVNAAVATEMVVDAAVVEAAEKMMAAGMAAEGIVETTHLLRLVQPCLHQSGLVVCGT